MRTMMGKTAVDQIVTKIDPARLIDRLARYVEISSPTGSELTLAEAIRDELVAAGVDASVQYIGGDRGNVIARLRSHKPGRVVMLNAHLDTSYTGDEPELSGRGYKNRAIIDGDWMYGNGVHNMKNALASYVEIVIALTQSGEAADLPGEVVLLGAAGEIEKAPYGRYQGPTYEGYGVGTGYALSHGITADCCILGEPTANTVGLSNMGVLWVRLQTTGTMAHTQAAGRAENAIDKMRRVLDKLDPWLKEHPARYEYKGVRPSADVTAIEGGWPYRAGRTPVVCEAFACIRTPPGVRSIDIYRELRELVTSFGDADSTLEVDVHMYVSHDGGEIAPEEPMVQALAAAHEQITGEPPAFVPRGAYMDSSTLIAHGIPTVVYGASGRVRGTADEGVGADWNPEEGEHTYLPDLITGTEVVLETVRRLLKD
ncbi:MAG: acetylornithine deacetylase [Rhodoglobus sp.]|nr:acetylornithine deacetylase [Rhodoglobus sp.]